MVNGLPPVEEMNWVKWYLRDLEGCSMNRSLKTGLGSLLALVFSYAAIDKAINHDSFVNVLRGYLGGIDFLAPLLSLSVILFEIAIAIGLLVPSRRTAAAGAAATILCVFSVAFLLRSHFSNATMCGCWFSINIGNSPGVHLIVNSGLILLSLFLLFSEQTRLDRKTLHDAPPT